MRKMILCSIATAAMAFGAILASQKFEATKLTPLQLANIEALADGEGGGGDCRYLNGYKSWESEGGFLGKKRQFYDCCKVLREGYNPEGSCN